MNPKQNPTIAMIALIAIALSYTNSALAQQPRRQSREEAENALAKRKALEAGIVKKAEETAARHFAKSCTTENVWTTVREKKVYSVGDPNKTETHFLQYKTITPQTVTNYGPAGPIAKENNPGLEYIAYFNFAAVMMRSRPNGVQGVAQEWTKWEPVMVDGNVCSFELWYLKGQWQVARMSFQYRSYPYDDLMKELYKPSCEEIDRGITNAAFKQMKDEEESAKRAIEALRNERIARRKAQEDAMSLLSSKLSPCQDGKIYIAKIPESRQVYSSWAVYVLQSYDLVIRNYNDQEIIGNLDAKRALHCWFEGDSRRGFSRTNCQERSEPISFRFDVATKKINVYHRGGYRLVPCDEVREVMSNFR